MHHENHENLWDVISFMRKLRIQKIKYVYGSPLTTASASELILLTNGKREFLTDNKILILSLN